MDGKAKLAVIGTIVLVIAGIAVVLGEMRATKPLPVKIASPLFNVEDLVLPSPGDIQRLLNKLEPESPLKVDGKIGPATRTKWEQVYVLVSAQKADERFYKR